MTPEQDPTTTRQPRDGEDGSIVIYMMLAIATVGMLMFALVADGSRVLAGISDTSDVAQVAARAAARHVDPSTGRVDTYLATAAANTELAAADMTGTVSVRADDIAVTATDTVTLRFLAAIGKPSHTVTATRTAQLLDRSGTP